MTTIHTASDARRLTTSARTLIPSPATFDGTLDELVERCILPNLPSAASVSAFHAGIEQYVQRSDALFLLRGVRGTERRQIYTTESGVRFKATDNAPAWWIHAALTHGLTIAPEAFGEVMSTAPAHMFDIAGSCAPTANQAGWHIAHIFDVKDGRTDFAHWGRRDVIGRFVRNVHPCNYFLLPKTNWPQRGADRRVIGYFAELYARRYAEVWPNFLDMARVTVDILHRVAGPIRYSYALAAPTPNAVDAPSSAASARTQGETAPVAEYRASRLTFKRDVIESLADDAEFRVITPLGTFVMTKAQFYRDFANVAESRSYRENGSYNYSSLPGKAARYRVAGSRQSSGKE